MEFADIVKAYLEVGVLGLCAITIIYLVIINYKRNNTRNDKDQDRIDKKDEFLNNKLDLMIENSQKQSELLLHTIAENNNMLLTKVVREVTSHVPSPEENKELTKINEEINNILQNMLIEAEASRTCIVQYHNGGKGVNKQSFLKMSITNEQIKLGVKPLAPIFKDQFRSVLSYFVKEVEEKGYCYIHDMESIKDIDASMYEFMLDNGVKSKYGRAIRNKDGMCIGFLCIEFRREGNRDNNKIDKILKENQHIVETLLNLNVLGE